LIVSSSARAIPTASINTIITVTNTASSQYIVDGLSNPSITLVRGVSYTFNVNASGHPFYIKTVNSIGTANAYNDGVTNNGIAVGAITFLVPVNAPNTTLL